MSLHRPAGGVPWLCLAIVCALAGAPAAEAKGLKLPHLKLKKHESRPKVSRVDEVTLAVTANEPGASVKAIHEAARTTLAEGYDRFEVVSDGNAVPIAFPGEGRRTLTIFVKMSRAKAPSNGAANLYDANEVLKPAAPTPTK